MIKFLAHGTDHWEINSQSLYSDGTPMIKHHNWADIVDRSVKIVIQPNSMMEFINAMLLVDVINEARGSKVLSCVLAYIPGARQDRSNPDGDVLFTLASVAGMLNQRFHEVVVVDPHSNEAGRLIENMIEYPLEYIAEDIWQGYTGIIAPDKGAKARADVFGKTMGKPVYYGEKKRDVATGRLSEFSIDVPAGGHYLVVDDICDGGGTFIGLGEEIKRNGAYADLYVTHGIFSKGTSELKKYYKNIYTTDTRPYRDGLEVYVTKAVKYMEEF